MGQSDFRPVSEPTFPDPAALPGSEAVPIADTVPAFPLPPWANDGSPLRPAASPLPDGRRFASLSSLPADRRLPPRRDVPTPRHQRQEPAAEEITESLLAPDAAQGLAPVPTPQPIALPPPEARQLGFNCPGCFAVLIIKDPASYDGRPAPCPTCGSRIQPPQCMPESPFSIVHRADPIPPRHLQA